MPRLAASCRVLPRLAASCQPIIAAGVTKRIQFPTSGRGIPVMLVGQSPIRNARPPEKGSRPMRLFAHPYASRSRPFGRAHLLLTLAALLGASLLTLVNAPRALACPVCVSPDKITLSGEGIVGTASVTDPSVLAWFGAGQFMGFEQRSSIAKPVHTGTGVEMTRYYNNTGVPASYWSVGFDHMRFYLGAPGNAGYIFYEGALDTVNDPFAQALNLDQRTGKWYALTRDESLHMRQLLALAKGTPLTNSDSPQPFTSPMQTSGTQPFFLRALHSGWLPVGILAAIMLALVVSVGYRVLRVRRRPRPLVVDEAI
jgi:hypothetical protein